MSGPLRRRLVSDDSPLAGDVRALVVVVAERLQARSGELSRSMDAAIGGAIEDLGDPELTSMLQASVEGNVATILHMLRHGIPVERMQPITAATEYAVRLARAGVPAAALRRAYHIGSDDLLAEIFEEIQRLDCDPDLRLRLLHHLAGWMHRYVDAISHLLLEAHEAERQAVVEQNATEVSGLVHRVVSRERVDADHFAARTGHRLDQGHVAAVVWAQDGNQGVDQIEGLSSFAATLGAALGCSSVPLVTPIDRNTAWVWCGLGRRPVPVDVERVRRVLDEAPGVRISLGAPGTGVEGFRRSLEQARAVRVLADGTGRPEDRVASYTEDGAAVVALLARDLPATRRWVREALGGLAADTEAADRLRETVRVFLRTGSYAESSEQLLLHRNTVKYRIGRAEAERGRPFTEGRLDLELALHVCHLLGPGVLSGGGPEPADG